MGDVPGVLGIIVPPADDFPGMFQLANLDEAHPQGQVDAGAHQRHDQHHADVSADSVDQVG